MLTEVVVYDGHRWDDDWPEDLAGFVEFWKTFLDLIPEEHRAATRIEICAADGGGLRARVSYRRPETAEEATDRIRNASVMERAVEMRERRELARLQAKYQTDPKWATKIVEDAEGRHE